MADPSPPVEHRPRPRPHLAPRHEVPLLLVEGYRPSWPGAPGPFRLSIHRHRGRYVLRQGYAGFDLFHSCKLTRWDNLVGLRQRLQYMLDEPYDDRAAHLYETAARFVDDYVRSLYDLSDPAEAAEAMLVALGGPATVEPKAAPSVRPLTYP